MVNFEVARDYVVRDSSGSVMHDLVNATFGSNEHIPHEWYFLNVLEREEILKNQELAKAFVMFIIQYYPNYPWQFFIQDDYFATAICELELKAFAFRKKYEFNFDLDNVEKDYLAKSILLGDIATDFLIRYRGYSLIKSSGQNVILTARSDCHKRFEELLSKGYSLQRSAKVNFVPKPPIMDELGLYPEIPGFFYKLPVLPTRDIGYPIDEIIETQDGSYRKVMQLSKKLF